MIKRIEGWLIVSTGSIGFGVSAQHSGDGRAVLRLRLDSAEFELTLPRALAFWHCDQGYKVDWSGIQGGGSV